MSNLFFMGVDLNIAKTTLGLVTFDGMIVDKIESEYSLLEHSYEEVIENLINKISELMQINDLDNKSVLGIGVAVPGPTDHLRQKIYLLPSIKDRGWENLNLQKIISERIPDIPIAVENNSNAFTFGEFWKGAAMFESNIFGITVGNGVGGGIIQDGKIFKGNYGLAAELGHLTVMPDGPQCSCGNRGCLELYISAPALYNYMSDHLHAYPDSELKHFIDNYTCEDLRLNEIFELAKKGDRLARKTIFRFSDYLAVGIANVINLLDPHIIVLGGRMFENLPDELLANIKNLVDNKIFRIYDVGYELYISELGRDALIIGAAGVSKFATKYQYWGNKKSAML